MNDTNDLLTLSLVNIIVYTYVHMYICTCPYLKTTEKPFQQGNAQKTCKNMKKRKNM